MFVVAYFSYFSADLEQHIFKAESAYEAVVSLLSDVHNVEDKDSLVKRYPTLESILSDYCSNTDCLISVTDVLNNETYN